MPKFKIGIDVTLDGIDLKDAKQKVVNSLDSLNAEEIDVVEEEELEDNEIADEDEVITEETPET